MSDVGFAQIGDAAQPSPSIWGDCPKSVLNDLGLGVYRKVEFLGAVTGTVAAGILRPAFGDALSLDCDDDTVLALKAAEQFGYLDIETDGDDNDAAALFSEPIGKIVANSGKKLWLEAEVELGAVADQGVFFGLVEEAGASRDVLADNVGSNGVITESLIGFLQDAADQDAFDLLYRKDAGTVVNLLNDVTNATAIPSASRAAVAANTPVKLGLRFNGRTTLYFFVNGYKVATQEVDSTIDQAKDMCAILGVKTGAGAAQSIAAGWMAYAFQERT